MRARVLLTGLALLVSGCSGGRPATPTPAPIPDATPTSRSTPSSLPAPTPTPLPKPTTTPTPKRSPEPTGPDDPRWRFFVDDETRYTSAWFTGAQRLMIGYGCTPAPYYSSDARCPDGQGFHHGIDVALPCGTEILAGVAGRVVDPERPGRPGPAYGSTAFRLRLESRGERYDVLIGHAQRVFVEPGERVRAGQRIATAGARGAPDGCHLHFEQRRVDGGVSSAIDPDRLLELRRRR